MHAIPESDPIILSTIASTNAKVNTSTSDFGKKTKSSRPESWTSYNPLHRDCQRGNFVARSSDIDVKHLGGVGQAAARHKGNLRRGLSNCNIFTIILLTRSPTKCALSERACISTWQPIIFAKK